MVICVFVWKLLMMMYVIGVSMSLMMISVMKYMVGFVYGSCVCVGCFGCWVMSIEVVVIVLFFFFVRECW